MISTSPRHVIFLLLSGSFALPARSLGAPLDQAPPAPPDAAAKGLVLSGRLNVELDQLIAGDDEVGGSRLLVVAPSADWVAESGYTIGGELFYRSLRAEGEVFTGYGGAVRAGRRLRIGDKIYLWPLVSAGVTYLPGGDRLLPLRLFVPMLFHPHPNFFIGIGPHLEIAAWTWSYDGGATTGQFRGGVQTLVGGVL